MSHKSGFVALLFTAASSSFGHSPVAFQPASVKMLSLRLPKVIGHRGAKAVAPENTLASVRAAKNVGATFVELDVMLSKDKVKISLIKTVNRRTGQLTFENFQVPIIHHDNAIDRCTNGKGAFSDFTAEELLALDAGSWFAPEFAGERLPTLPDLLKLCQELELGLNLEIKHGPDRADMVPTEEETALERELAHICCQTIRAFGPPNWLLISSFSISALEVCKELLPEIPRSYLVVSIPPDWEATARRLDCASINFNHKVCTREQIDEISRRIPMYAYTVNEPDRARELLAWGVSGVFSDNPHTVMDALRQQAVQTAPSN